MDMLSSMSVSGQALAAESLRMRTAAENIANQDSVRNGAGTGPYRAKQVFFRAMVDKATGATGVQVQKVGDDMKSPLTAKYDPGNPFADAQGVVQYPNVDPTVENINMKEAQRAYDANLAAIDTARTMAQRTIDMIK
jgi:flagellar basal-body rod protein FlgC